MRWNIYCRSWLRGLVSRISDLLYPREISVKSYISAATSVTSTARTKVQKRSSLGDLAGFQSHLMPLFRTPSHVHHLDGSIGRHICHRAPLDHERWEKLIQRGARQEQ